jgi:two-component system sensor histidine kinase TctE
MADRAARVATHRSLRSRLLWRVLLPLAATWSIGSAVAFSLSWVLAGRSFDRALLDDAYAIAANVGERDGVLALKMSPRELDNVLFDREEKEYFSVNERSGRVLASNADLSSIPARAMRSGSFADANLQGEVLRVAALHSDGAIPFTVVVAQTTFSRNRLLAGLLERSLLPQVGLLLLLGAYLWRQISRELMPLGDLQRALEQRHSSDLEPVAGEPISSDVEKLRDAVNSLLARVGQGVQAQREFAGNVAHDLRTPLAGIRASAEYGLAHNEPATWRRQLESIVQSEERASRLVDQLLALALADEARDSVKLEPLRMDELVRRILLPFVARADAAGIDLGAEGLDTPTLALASPILLEGALTNLIDNALRYGRGGSPPTLTVAIEQRAPHVLISVTDTGPGLDPKQREQLKRRWAQGVAGVKLGAGAGLGLAIASRYAELMGGSLQLEVGPGGRGVRAVIALRESPARDGPIAHAATGALASRASPLQAEEPL